MRKRLFVLCFVALLTLVGCSNESASEESVDVEPITTIEQYNRMTEQQLVDALREPLQKEEVAWTTPSNGQQITLHQWNYELDTIPVTFFIVDDEVVRLNYYIAQWDETLQANDAEQLMAYLSVEPEGEEYRIRVDNEKNMQVAWPKPNIDEIYAKHQRGDIQEIRITYDMTPF